MKSLAITAVAVLTAIPTIAAAAPGCPHAKCVLDELKVAFQKADVKRFERIYHPAGLDLNIVGGSSTTGRSLFRQASRKGWYFKCDLKKSKVTLPTVKAERAKGSMALLVHCDLQSVRKKRTVEQVWALLVRKRVEKPKKAVRWWMLSAGEKKSEVEALRERYLGGKPLAPKRR